jgi:transcription elongation factor Elf1
MVLTCPTCGDDRVIPLTFGPVIEEIMVEKPDRPLAKCVVCGYRLSAWEIEAQEAPSPALTT